MIVSACPAYADLLHRTPKELEGRLALELTHADDRTINSTLIAKLRESGEPFVIIKRYLRPDGASVWVRNHISMISIGFGKTLLCATCEPLRQPEQAEGRSLVRRAQEILRMRRLRQKHFSIAMHAEAEINLLLDLFSETESGRQVSVTGAAYGANLPLTTALRHLAVLEQQGLIERSTDPMDRRRTIMALSACGRERIIAFLRAAFNERSHLTATLLPDAVDPTAPP